MIRLDRCEVLIDGAPTTGASGVSNDEGATDLVVAHDRLDVRWHGFPGVRNPVSIGVRAVVTGARRYLRSGYQSWDGSELRDVAAGDPAEGHAVTALIGQDETVVIGFLRHDRFQSRIRFRPGADGELAVDIETLLDEVPHHGEVRMETLAIVRGREVEETLRAWARLVAGASAIPPRTPSRRLTGWCSWYHLYASITEENLHEHLAAAAAFRDDTGTPLDVFLVDDGFTPEMGDWLDFRPTFPHREQLFADVAASGFVPGAWIAPFLVGNRSRLFAEHPDWVVHDAAGGPLVGMSFYGEFRWHKRSEEYHVLDVTHPDAEAWIRSVFRTWRHRWGVRLFKADFLHLGSSFGPERARWHRPGLSRMAVWMHMAGLMREEIGDDAFLLGCGTPIWAPIGLFDAVRIGRDVGAEWTRSAGALLSAQACRNFGNGILWQSDPDCVLLRDRFHHLSDDQVELLARFAGDTGGVIMTSDHLGELSPSRRALFAELIGDAVARPCDFPRLGHERGAVTIRPASGRERTIALDPD